MILVEVKWGFIMRIEAKNLVKIYGDRSVVNDISFYMDKGEVVCLLGPNGAGKTTTFYMIVGLVKPNTGSVFIDGQDITAWPMNLRAKSGIGYLPQENSIFRRVEIARALAASPDFMLLDEPFAGIDPIAIGDIKDNIRKISEEKGLGVLITDHNPKATLSITDRAYVIFDGKIKIQGKSEDVAVDPVAKEFYLGKDFQL